MRYRRILAGYLELSRIFTAETGEVRFFIRTSCRNPRKIAMRKTWEYVQWEYVQSVLVKRNKKYSVYGGNWIDMKYDDYKCLNSILIKDTTTATLDAFKYIKELREEIVNKLDRGDEV